MNRRSILYATVLAMIVVSFGCAEAVIRKVPNRTDYEQWSDADQRRVDSMCGHRYYLTRPYVVVNRPFPVKSKTYLVDAQVSADGRRIRIIGDKQKHLAADLGHIKFEGDLTLLARQVWQSDGEAQPAETALPPAGDPDDPVAEADPLEPPDDPEETPPAGAVPDPMGGDPDGDAGGGAGTGLPPEESLVGDPASGGATIPPPTDSPEDVNVADSPTGTAEFRISTDKKGIPVFDVNDYFSIVQQPDFEEQYVVNPKANLGSLDLSFTQGPGGILMAMGMQVDNSVITRPLVDAYADLVKAGAAAAKGAMGLPTAEGDQLVAPFDAADQARGLAAGSVVTLRIHVVSMATPGMYPILKASEILDARNCLRSLTRCYECRGQLHPCSRCCAKDDVESRVEALDLAVPRYPFTRIAYAVHQTVIVEHLIPETDSLLNAGLQAFNRAAAPEAEATELTVDDDSTEKLIAALDNLLTQCGCTDYKVTAIDAVSPQGTYELGEIDALIFRFQRLVDGRACSIHAALRDRDAQAVRCCLVKSGQFKASARIQAIPE